jgi:type I restriction enzyme, S subunit
MKLPEGWKEIELGEIFEFQTKSKIKAGEGNEEGKYKFFTSSDKQSKFIDKYNHNGEFLIFATGGHTGVHYCNEKFATSTDCFIVKIIDKIMTKYIYYYLSGQISLLEDGFKGAGLKHLSKNYLGQIKISYPEDKKIQKQIILILEKAEKLKQNRKDSDKLAKEYLQSTFYEMFGDIALNKKKWDLLNLPLIVKKDKNSIRRGPFGGSLKKDIFTGQGYLVYEQRHAIHNDFDYAQYYISKEKYKEMEMFKVVPGDLIISCSGVTLGKIAEIPKNAKLGIINQALLKISLDPEKVNNEYFKYLFRGEAIQKILFDFSRGSGIPNFPSIYEVKNVKFPIPPLPLQQKFASIVEQVEKLKEKQKQSKEEIDNLFNSLMQRAFNGELVR